MKLRALAPLLLAALSACASPQLARQATTDVASIETTITVLDTVRTSCAVYGCDPDTCSIASTVVVGQRRFPVKLTKAQDDLLRRARAKGVDPLLRGQVIALLNQLGVTTGGVYTPSVSGLTDVDVTGAVSGDLLQFNGTDWVDRTALAALVLEAASTSGALLKVSSGVLEAREGDDSGYVDVRGRIFGGRLQDMATSTFYLDESANNLLLFRMGENYGTAWNATGTYGDLGTTAAFEKGGQVTLTDNTATTVVVIPLGSGERTGGKLLYTIDCTDGTDHQSVSGVVSYSAVNKAGAYTTSIGAATESVAASTGTLASTWTMTSGSNLVNVRLTADTSLTPTTLRVRVELLQQDAQGATIQ